MLVFISKKSTQGLSLGNKLVKMHQGFFYVSFLFWIPKL